jgi:DNA-directed RNA polymerase specialized sigma24 family protein
MDDQACRNLLAAHDGRASLTRRLRRRYGDEAEDFVDEAVLRCASPGIEYPKAWSGWKAEGLAIDAARHRASAQRNAWKVVGPVAPAGPEEAYEDSELGERAVTEWLALPDAQRAAVRAWADGASHAEIGRRLGRSADAAKKLVQRGLTTLRDRLHDAELGIAAVAVRVRRRAGAAQNAILTASASAVLVIQTLTVAVALAATSWPASPSDQASVAAKVPHLRSEAPGLPTRRSTRIRTVSIPTAHLGNRIHVVGRSGLPPHDVVTLVGPGAVDIPHHEPIVNDAKKATEDSKLRDGNVEGFAAEVQSCVEDGRLVVSPSFVGCADPDR